MIRCFIFALIFMLTSCNTDFHNQYERDFDISLMNRNEKFHLSGDYDSLVKLNKDYYEKATKMGYDDGKALCYINLANVNIPLQNYQNAHILFNKAEKILRNSGNNIHKAKFYNDYGSFQVELKRLDKAFKYNEMALNYTKGTDESPFQKEVLFKIYYKRGGYLRDKKEYEEALKYFHKAEKLDPLGRADCVIGDIYLYELQKPDSAEIYLTKVADAANAQGRSDGVALNANTVLGEYYIWTRQYDKAEKVLNRALEINKKTKHIFSQYTKYIYADFKSLYEQKGNKEMAYYYLQAYVEEKNRSDAAVLKAINHDMEDFISDVEEDSLHHRNNILILCITSISALLVLGLYVWKSIRHLKGKRKILKQEAEQLKSQMYDTSREEMIEQARKNDPSFLDTFKEAYPGFIEKVLAINPDLESSDLIFCAMLKLHFTSKEIATYTLVQHRSVQQKKYRLRKKLNIPTETDMYQFFDSLI
ncbi:tetratricopeptide repeat protein [Chryseobacterium sp. 52]|uniref:tetratricopeptide repeat protein n=1 Tax=Chryseobacterium sp. 52 TaxID=2035213 RepID=UPI000C4CDDC8|nr:tetratricopeptide repeat protein [Chryseobacterium sp. 52]PIF45416.1 tetratricopeptide repeat protein [Chryseobacterium sp. 52]